MKVTDPHRQRSLCPVANTLPTPDAEFPTSQMDMSAIDGNGTGYGARWSVNIYSAPGSVSPAVAFVCSPFTMQFWYGTTSTPFYPPDFMSFTGAQGWWTNSEIAHCSAWRRVHYWYYPVDVWTKVPINFDIGSVVFYQEDESAPAWPGICATTGCNNSWLHVGTYWANPLIATVNHSWSVSYSPIY
jgi:hypothetical protein